MTSTRHTAAMVNQRLIGREITLTGPYINALTKTEFTCHLGHTWLATPNNVLRGKGCPHCAQRAFLTRDMINEKIKDQDIEMASENRVTSGRALFRHLVCGHVWESAVTNVISGSGCPSCANNIKLSREDINTRIEHRGLEMIEERTNERRPLFRCVCSHEWRALPSNILRGKGCPVCADYGFNPLKPAWEYAFTRDGYVKYGITNDLPRRLNEHRRHGEINLVHERYHEVGQLALDWERHIRKTLGGRYATKEQCPDGWTETLSLDHLSLLLG